MYEYDSDDDSDSVGEIVLCRAGACVYTTNMDVLRKLRKWFTIKTKIGRGSRFFKSISSFSHKFTDGYIRCPRFGLMKRLGNPRYMKQLGFVNPKVINQITTKSKLYYGDRCDFEEWEATLSENQIVVTDWLHENVFTDARRDAGTAGCILKMTTGTGKTYIGATVIHQLCGQSLVVCRDTGDCEQWVKTLVALFPELRIGQYHSKIKTDGDIIVAVINTIAKARTFIYKIFPGHGSYSKHQKTEELDARRFFKRFKLIVWDECHTYCSKSGIKAFMKAQAPYMLGLSATPNDRPDKFDPVAHWNIGPVVDASQIDGYCDDDVTYSCKVKAVEYQGPSEFIQPIVNLKTGSISTSLMIKQFSEDPYRLKLICQHIESLYEKNHNTVVFADRKEYLDIISAALSKCRSIRASIMIDDTTYAAVKKLVGGAKAGDMEDANIAGRIILTTYAYFGTGKSIKRLDAMIFATPRRSHISQFLGRIFRKGSDPDIRRRLIDIVDVSTSLRSQYYVRKAVYETQYEVSRIFKLCRVKVKWDSLADSTEEQKQGKGKNIQTIMSDDKLRSIIRAVKNE